MSTMYAALRPAADISQQPREDGGLFRLEDVLVAVLARYGVEPPDGDAQMTAVCCEIEPSLAVALGAA